MKKFLEKKVLARIDEKGLNITYGISSVLSKILLLYLVAEVVMSLYNYSVRLYYGPMGHTGSFDWFSPLIFFVILPSIKWIVPYVLAVLIRNLLNEKLEVKLERSSIEFVTGAFLAFKSIGRVLGFFTDIALIFSISSWTGNKDIIVLLNPLLNALITVVYIFLAVKYLKGSNYLIKITSEVRTKEVR